MKASVSHKHVLSVSHFHLIFMKVVQLCSVIKFLDLFLTRHAEIVVSGGMSMPQILSTLDPQTILGDRTGASRS